MKKKGFTLIELLAVIVILAIIAVITVPKIADMISSSRKGGAEDSFYGTLKAAELGYTKALQSNTNLKESTCTIEDSKITCDNGVKIDVSGKTPESGTLVIDSAGSTIAKALTLNGYKCYGDLSTENPCVKADVDVASESLIKKVTTSGDGLYKDSYEDGRYVFKGQAPNNYLTFNNESAGWRIVSVEADGTLKIIRKTNLKSLMWDISGTRDIPNNTYCENKEELNYGCNAWASTTSIIGSPNVFKIFSPTGISTTATKIYQGTVTKDSSLNTYLNNEYYNNLTDKEYIVSHNFNIGSPGNYSSTEDFTVANKLTKEYIWNGKIGLMEIMDYIKASSALPTTANFNECYKLTTCSNDNYLNGNYYEWTISLSSGLNTAVFILRPNGTITSAGAGYSANVVRPVLYLKASIELTGSGTEADPYIIK